MFTLCVVNPNSAVLHTNRSDERFSIGSDGDPLFFGRTGSNLFRLAIRKLLAPDVKLSSFVRAQAYAISRDGTQITFSMQDKSGRSQVWIAPTDGMSAPRTVASQTSDDCAFFLPDGDLVFRVVEGEQNYVYRSKPDGTERHRISHEPILDTYNVSHDGRWMLAVTRGPDGAHPYLLRQFQSAEAPL